MTEKSKKNPVKFGKKCLRLVGLELWWQKISFYYDRVTFHHKSYPFSENIQLKAKIWRKRSEGLKLTLKGRKTGNNGCQVKSFVNIACGKGIIKCQQWDPEVKFIGRNYKEFVKEHFPNTLEISTNPDTNLFYEMGAQYRNQSKHKEPIMT